MKIKLKIVSMQAILFVFLSSLFFDIKIPDWTIISLAIVFALLSIGEFDSSKCLEKR